MSKDKISQCQRTKSANVKGHTQPMSKDKISQCQRSKLTSIKSQSQPISKAKGQIQPMSKVSQPMSKVSQPMSKDKDMQVKLNTNQVS